MPHRSGRSTAAGLWRRRADIPRREVARRPAVTALRARYRRRAPARPESDEHRRNM